MRVELDLVEVAVDAPEAAPHVAAARAVLFTRFSALGDRNVAAWLLRPSTKHLLSHDAADGATRLVPRSALDVRVVVGYAGGEPAAAAIVIYRQARRSDHRWLELPLLSVRADFEKRGYGGAVVGCARAVGARLSCGYLYVSACSDAIPFWTRLGHHGAPAEAVRGTLQPWNLSSSDSPEGVAVLRTAIAV